MTRPHPHLSRSATAACRLAFAFYRGAAAIMAADLARPPRPAWSCNCVATVTCSTSASSPRRNGTSSSTSTISTRRFPRPWEWDVKRLAASFVIAGRHIGFSDARRPDGGGPVRGYRERLARFAAMRSLDVWYARLDLGGNLEVPAEAKIPRQAEQAKKRARTWVAG